MDLQLRLLLPNFTNVRFIKNISNLRIKESNSFMHYNLYAYKNIDSASQNSIGKWIKRNQSINQNKTSPFSTGFGFGTKHNMVENDKRKEAETGKESEKGKEADIESQFEKEMRKLKKKAEKEKRAHKNVLYLLIFSFFGIFAFYESYNPNFFVYDIVLQFCLKYLDSELCHDMFIWMGKYNLLPYDTSNDSIYSVSEIKQLKFLNPFGVAAGFDKNGESIEALLKLGFSFIEIGTVTPRGQAGNKKPRIFRDNETKTVINSCGFNNIGCDEVTENLKRFRINQKKKKLLSRHIVGVSIGKNKDSENIIEDLIYCIKKIGRYADYIAINVSSPNTPGLRDNQEATKLRKIIIHVKEEINKLNQNVANKKSSIEINTTTKENDVKNDDKNDVKNDHKNNTVLNKQNELSQNSLHFKEEDKKEHTFKSTSSSSSSSSSSSFTTTITSINTNTVNNIVSNNIVSFPLDVINCEDIYSDNLNESFWQNTTKEKPLLFVKLSPDLSENDRKEIATVLLEEKIDGMIISNTTIQDFNIESFKNKKGGISGSKLKDISTKMISDMYSYTNKQIPIIASGGILNGEDALEKIESGASVCQLYTSLVFNGVKTAVQMKREFDTSLYRKGYYNLQAAIGASHKKEQVQLTKNK